jgi:phospholipid/cholesterol/gamma-HCH transport system ATP-binding protein
MKLQKNGFPIQVKGLRKSFGPQVVLNGIDLQVRWGETLAVLGRSGTGKSVLLKLLIGLQTPDSGSVCIVGQEIVGLEARKVNEIRKKMGFLFQQAALYDSLTVVENVTFPLSRHTPMAEPERKKRARELLASVGMEKDLEKLPSQISGGMQKRVGLARALALDPEILLFDEPTAGLDPITAAETGDLIVELKKKRSMTSVVVTHDVRKARTFADRLVLMDKGNVVAHGTFADLRASQDSFVHQFLEDQGGG